MSDVADHLKPGTRRVRKSRALAAERAARLKKELPALWEISSALVDHKMLPEWDSDDPEAIAKVVLEALKKLSAVKRYMA